jgi:two-component system NarL family sensor kinase
VSRRPDRTVRGSIIALVVTALLAFTVVATGAIVAARRMARAEALVESTRTARVVSQIEFVPELPAVIAGDAVGIARLDDAVNHRRQDGYIVRVKVWRIDGTVLYSDDHRAIGHRYPLDQAVRDSIEKQTSSASISTLNNPENITELGISDRLVEVYTPLNLDDGTHLAFELYSTDSRIRAAETRMTNLIVPLAVAALLVLLVTQLPVSVWLVRRVGRAQDDRSRLLRNSLAASARERRTIARDLHDGVVQDLAGVGYALGAFSRTLPDDTTPSSRTRLDNCGSVLQSAVGSLRTLMVDIYPPDLTADGLHAAIADLADKLRAASQAEVVVTVDLRSEPSPEVAATVYRFARECLSNVLKHARAQHVMLSLTDDETTIRLRLTDDGVGMPPARIDRRADGHVGLQLLQDAAKDLGGEMRISSAEGRGTTVTLELPSTASSESDPEAPSNRPSLRSWSRRAVLWLAPLIRLRRQRSVPGSRSLSS